MVILLLLGCIACIECEDAAYFYRCSVVCVCACVSVCLSVCLLVINMSCDKTAEPVDILFGLGWAQGTMC